MGQVLVADAVLRPGQQPGRRRHVSLWGWAFAAGPCFRGCTKNHSDTAIRWRKSVRHSGSRRTGSALMDRECPSQAPGQEIPRDL